MDPDISNMTLNVYLMYQGRHKDWERGCTSRKSVASARNRILPCVTFNSIHHNSHREVEIDNMTLEEYARYELAMSTMKSEIQVPTQVFTSWVFSQSKHTPKPPLDEKNSSLAEILDDLFRIAAKNIKKIEHEVLNRCDDIIDYEDSDHEDGKLFDLPTFPATNKFTSVCEQVKENIDVNTT
nr:hypothetical protein [Tanacetum cinerariifolium]